MKITDKQALVGDGTGAQTPGGAAPGGKVADRTWQRRVLLFDGLLIALLGWLLWTLYTERGAEAIEPPKTQLEIDAPAVGAQGPGAEALEATTNE